jgi:benzodiazapine receptor
MLRSTLSLILWLLISYLAAFIGSIASINAADFYAELTQPTWAPPANVFGPVWSILYTLMGISAWLTWQKSGFHKAAPALILFLIQLVINSLWSLTFFHWQLGALAFLTICLLWGLILATIMAFWKHRPTAAALLIPYLLWVTFATALSFNLWQNNPGVL